VVTAAAASSMTAAHSVRTNRGASTMETSATISPVESRGNSTGMTGEATVAGMAKTAVNAVIEMGIVVSFVTIPITEAPSIAKVMKVSIIKAMVEVPEEKKRRKAHVKR
jgi:hypothetical protein